MGLGSPSGMWPLARRAGLLPGSQMVWPRTTRRRCFQDVVRHDANACESHQTSWTKAAARREVLNKARMRCKVCDLPRLFARVASQSYDNCSKRRARPSTLYYHRSEEHATPGSGSRLLHPSCVASWAAVVCATCSRDRKRCN